MLYDTLYLPSTAPCAVRMHVAGLRVARRAGAGEPRACLLGTPRPGICPWALQPARKRIHESAARLPAFPSPCMPHRAAAPASGTAHARAHARARARIRVCVRRAPVEVLVVLRVADRLQESRLTRAQQKSSAYYRPPERRWEPERRRAPGRGGAGWGGAGWGGAGRGWAVGVWVSNCGRECVCVCVQGEVTAGAGQGEPGARHEFSRSNATPQPSAARVLLDSSGTLGAGVRRDGRYVSADCSRRHDRHPPA
jgi:hypothetical protein